MQPVRNATTSRGATVTGTRRSSARACSLRLAFLSPRPTAEAYAAFYRAIYRALVSAYHGRRIDADTVQDEQPEYAAELWDYLGRVLEGAPAECSTSAA